MARKAKTADEASAQANKAGNGETISGYFRRVFKEDRRLLNTRSNEEVLNRWRADHPGQEVTKSVKVGLQNVKSILRSKGRKRKARKAAAAPAAAANSPPARPAPKKTNLERLEEQIDDVLTFARGLDREGLGSIIGHLRHARNEVVWMMGQ
jgi:hypothetical protein